MSMILRCMSVFIVSLLMACTQNPQLTVTEQLYLGQIAGYAFDEYSLFLNEGDKLKVRLSEPKLDVIIFAPMNVILSNDETLTIASTEEYILRILMPRALARRGGVFDYSLQVYVESD